MRFSTKVAAGMLIGLAGFLNQVQAETTTPLYFIQADKLQAVGLNGQGIKVGVISNGIQGIGGLQQSGDLPSTIGVVGNNQGSGGEGTGMLQLIHQIAPNAQLFFCSEYQERTISQCANDLITNFSVNIVVDDLARDLDFEPTVDAVNYDDVLAQHPGVLALHSAGNYAQGTYIGPYTPTPLTVASQSFEAQDFGKSVGQASNPYEQVILPAGQGQDFCYYDSDDPSSPAPSSNDNVGIWILSSSGAVLASQNGTGVSGCVVYNNTGSSAQTIRIVLGVLSRNNTSPLFFALLGRVLGGTDAPLSILTPGGSGVGLSTSANVLSIGASNDGNLMEPFSQTGPYTVAWSATQTGTDSNGLPILSYTRLSTPALLQKPELTGEDGWPIAPDAQYFDYGVFPGTSAAAPSVAGVAALLMQAGLSRNQIVATLEQTATPLKTDSFGNPISQTTDTWNQMDGYGMIQGYSALLAAGIQLPQPVITTPSGFSVTAGINQSVSFAGSCTAPAGTTITGYSWNSGNGQTVSGQTATFSYPTPETFTVSFNCKDSQGLQSGIPATVTVNVTANTGGGNGGGGGGGSLDLLSLLVLFGLTLGVSLRGNRASRAPGFEHRRSTP